MIYSGVCLIHSLASLPNLACTFHCSVSTRAFSQTQTPKPTDVPHSIFNSQEHSGLPRLHRQFSNSNTWGPSHLRGLSLLVRPPRVPLDPILHSSLRLPCNAGPSTCARYRNNTSTTGCAIRPHPSTWCCTAVVRGRPPSRTLPSPSPSAVRAYLRTPVPAALRYITR